MKLFNGHKEMNVAPATPPRVAIADMPSELFVIFETLYNRNRRLYGVAEILGGSYPLPSNPSVDPPTDVCGRIAYDMSNIRQQLDEMDAHLHRLEQLLGIAVEDVPKELGPTPEPLPENVTTISPTPSI
jgi:hypothetical protein